MAGLGERVAYGEMVTAWCRDVACEGRGPALGHHAILLLKLGALVATHHSVNWSAGGGCHQARAEFSGERFVELEIVIEKRRLDEGAQIKERAQGHAAFDEVSGQVRRPCTPTGGEHHAGEMTASGVTAYDDAVPVEA